VTEAQNQRVQEIRALQDRLGPVEFDPSSVAPTTARYSPDYERAALLSSFDPDELELSPNSFGQLLKDCVVIAGGEIVRFALNPDVRRRVLRQLGSRERMQETLGAVENPPTDPLQEAITRIVDDKALVGTESAPLAWLQTAHQALSWFAGIVPTEQPEAVRARIETIGYLDRFERLVGDNFSGREDALHELREYVGVLPAGAGVVHRASRRSTSFQEQPALVICGPGGIGKSTLLAKFILDYAGDKRLPFVYVNFDSPTVRAGDPKTIVFEALRQLAIQYSDFTITITRLRERWQAETVRLADLTGSAKHSRDQELSNIVRDEFVSLLYSLQLADRPLLLVLDTFEAVQERQRGDIAVLYGFLRDLQEQHSALRVVISGRAAPGDVRPDPAGSAGDPAREPIRTRVLELKGLDRATSTEYLIRAGLSVGHAEEVARYLVPEESMEEGASPLSLRVAADIWRRDLERSELDTNFWAQLRAGRIQAQLITRYIRHTDRNSLAGRLALPSLLLRRIDAAALSAVVAPAWEIPLLPGQEVTAFQDLAGLISLVLERGGVVVQARPEVQRQVVDLLSDAESGKVARLHNLAVVYYARLGEQSDSTPVARREARFDEVVHRLARGDDDGLVRSRWLPECAEFVAGRIPLLSGEAQAVLEQLAGLELTAGMRAMVPQRVWQGDAVTRARRLLESGNAPAVIRLAAERDDWARPSELSLLLARAHLAVDQPLDAVDAAQAALEESDSEVSSALVCDLQLVAAEAAYALDRPQEVLYYADEALTIAREREDAPRIISALLLQVSVKKHRDMGVATVMAVALQAELVPITGPLAESDEVKLLALLDWFPTLVPAAVRLGGLRRLPQRAARQLARSITAVDEQVSAARGEKPGFLALSSGLSVGGSVTRTWQEVLSKLGSLAESAVLRVLEQDVPARALLVDELAEALAAAVRTGQEADEASTVSRVDVQLNQRRRHQLVEALIEELGVEALNAILADEFDRSLGSITSLDQAPEQVVETLVEAAEREDWLSALIIAARNRLPSAPRMLQAANELDLSTIHFAANRLANAVDPRDHAVVLARLGEVEGQIGRLELPEQLIGTGLLVSPELLLIASSSIGGGRVPLDLLQVRFGRKADSKGRVFDDGTSYPVARDGLVDVIPYGRDSGFALLRLDGYPADEPLGSGRGQRFHLRRGFSEVSHFAPISEGQNAFVCWQQAARLELHIERRAMTPAAGGFTLPSLGDSSAGAPCFNRSMEFLGLVLEDRSGVAVIVPGNALWQSLRDHGHGRTVGVALA
jgi:hypothetical protein